MSSVDPSMQESLEKFQKQMQEERRLAAHYFGPSRRFSEKEPPADNPEAPAADDRHSAEDRHFVIRQTAAQHLRVMKEPSLMAYSSVEAYRFLWLRSFDHPLAVRIQKDRDRITLFAVELDGDGTTGPGRIARRVERSLSRNDWDTLQARLAQTDFWHMSAYEYVEGLDGADWIMEGRVPDSFHMVERWCPNGAFQSLCMWFIEQSGISIPLDDIY